MDLNHFPFLSINLWVRNCYNVERSNELIAIVLGGTDMTNKLETLSTVRIQKSDDLYKVVDTLNRTLKDQNLMFGMSLDEDDDETAVFTIYRT